MEGLPEVLRCMAAWGFKKLNPQPSAGKIVMTGELVTETQGAVPCEVWLDRKFETPLQVRIKKIPPHLPRVLPHLGPHGWLCYAAPGTEVIDIFEPVEQTRTSLLQAAQVLEQVMAGKMVKDLQEEFFAYWPGAPCYYDIEKKSSGPLGLLRLSDDDKFVLTDDLVRSRKKFEREHRTIESYNIAVALITSNAAPRPLQEDWPPKTVRHIFDWQRQLDDACRRKIRDKILEAYRSKRSAIMVVIESKKTGYSYGLLVRDLQRYRPRNQRSTDQSQPIFDCPITPLRMLRLDDKYLCERNIPGQKTLQGKRIALIGCGTIGGFLAEMLVKAGAGVSGGEILLIDNDSLSSENLGRHRLGFNFINCNKAFALAEELKVVMPLVSVRAFDNIAQTINLKGIDLIVDATGEEAFGHWLAKNIKYPLLHVWIEGPGTAVRALLKTRDRQACYRCLSDYNKRGELLSVVDGLEPIFAGQGCEGLYVPFSASVSIQAAALALDCALAWVADKPWPSLSTKLTDTSRALATSDCSPVKRLECPACAS